MLAVRTLVIALVVVLGASAAWGAPSIPADTLQLSCEVLRRSRGLCAGLQAALRRRTPGESHEVRVQRARRWASQSSVQQQARSLARRCARTPRSVSQQLDFGLAQLVAGRIGEGMHHALAAYQQAPQMDAAADLVYLGVLLVMDQLNPDQQVDWAADIASRLSSPWRLPTSGDRAAAAQRPPRAIDIARAIHLAELAEDGNAVRQFVRFGQAYYPRDHTWATIAATLPAQKKISSAARDTPPGDRN